MRSTDVNEEDAGDRWHSVKLQIGVANLKQLGKKAEKKKKKTEKKIYLLKS